jgi:hypothetical protein
MTLLKGKLDLPWSIGEHGLQIKDCQDRRVIDQKDDWDESDFVDLYPEQAALIVRAVNAHEALVEMVAALMGALRDEDDSFDVKYDARKLLASLD